MTGSNRTQVPAVPVALPLLSSAGQTVVSSLLPSGSLYLSSAAAEPPLQCLRPQAAVDYCFDCPDLSRPTAPRDAPSARISHPPLSYSYLKDFPERSIDPVPTLCRFDMPQRWTRLLRRVSTPAALPEMPPHAEIKYIEPVDLYSHSDWARERRAEPVCDAIIRYCLLGNRSVLHDDTFLDLPPHNPNPNPRCWKCAV